MTDRANPFSGMEPVTGLNSPELARAMGPALQVGKADEHRDVVKEMFARALTDANEEMPAYLLNLAAQAKDAPGCSALAARA